MRVLPIDQSSELWPLPPDYNELTEKGQRLARVNACRQWMWDGWSSEEMRINAYVASVRFFDLYYLHPDYEVDWDPMYYDAEPLPTPPMHYDLLRQHAQSRMAIAIMPRGSAKSTLIRTGIMCEMLSHPAFGQVYATSSLDNTRMTGHRIREQFMGNERINDDFGPECRNGRLTPRRGEAPFGDSYMQIGNGSYLKCVSSESKLRGLRPARFKLDDPEFDEKAATSMSLVREYMDTLLFRVALPMVMRGISKLHWTATFVSKRHYAWHAMSVDDAGRALDPRFDNWDRMLIRSEYDVGGEPRSCWPEMWPITREDRDRRAQTNPRLRQAVSLEEIKEILGYSAYAAEYLGKPGAGDEVYFPELEETRHGYWIESVDGLSDQAPGASEDQICWNTHKDGIWQLKKLPLRAFLSQTRQFMTVDTSYTSGPDSDSKVACLMAVTPENELFVLDLWAEQCQQQILVQQTLRMSDLWRCRSVHVEAILEGNSVWNELTSLVNQRAREAMGVEHLPGIVKLNPGRMRKEDKIAGLSWRFRQGMIKLPLRRRNEKPWRDLFNQIQEFNPEAANGGLQHDDELDCVAMSMFILKGRVRDWQGGRAEEKVRDPLELLRNGEVTDETTGLPNAMRLDWSKVTVSEVFDAVEALRGQGGRGARARSRV